MPLNLGKCYQDSVTTNVLAVFLSINMSAETGPNVAKLSPGAICVPKHSVVPCGIGHAASVPGWSSGRRLAMSS